VLCTFLAWSSKVLLSSKHISRAFLLFSEDRWFSLKRYDFWLFV
jgi:hypothetical protein